MNDLNWPAIEAAHRLDMGVFIISPNDKGGKLYEPPQKLVELCAPLTPMQFNDLYCLARPEVHTLSCGAAKPADFDEHVRALQFYDRIPETIAPIEKRLRAEMERVLGADWCARWFEGLPNYVDVPGEINVSGNPAAVDLREVARPGGVGQDALQPARPGRPLVSRPERGEGARTGFTSGAAAQPVRRAHPGNSGGRAPDVVRETGAATQRELRSMAGLFVELNNVVIGVTSADWGSSIGAPALSCRRTASVKSSPLL